MSPVAVPEHRVGKCWAAQKLGHFVDAAGYARFVAAYQAGMAQLPQTARSFDVPTRLGSVRAYRFGAGGGVPLLLLTGRGGSTPLWRANLTSLLSRRSVYCIDLLGEPGMSVQDKPITGPQDHADWLEDVMAGLRLGAVHVVGLSIGGWAAVNHAIRYPGRVRSLVLLDPALTFAPLTWKMVLVSLGSVIPGTPQAIRNRLLSWSAGGAQVDESIPEAALISAAARDFRICLPSPKVFSDKQLRRLSMPVLTVIAGRTIVHDAQRAAQRARSVVPDNRVNVWPDASYALNGEFPERISELTHEFLDTVEAA
ncbi:alpha/beta fold hydrolase [Mycobacteroides abscessus]|uniref:alpha/beta fold hydrolase n=1 Tax=Mycobacteroides abscessus TaxID=36809 RepID=UPI0003194A89|nr:alpha/beta hydrolase [Mycobacteroides abscessus]ORA30229.1 alpha/beta hydrolase [Mycobacteroides abscessus subsp. bolletii]TPF68646.1 carboxylesterase [Mycobacteroides abscessus subsp. bolletii]SHT59590.1 carboxylesterase NP [Mycobacteroides abscessus subsp. bolletii]SHW14155.1 carboxylesterase NP [Mycobacteroides abscessus subsp. bolletii]SHW57615.1 carboxylesterase NP [Mycobacteroides abscessus subsp. bolletii]